MRRPPAVLTAAVAAAGGVLAGCAGCSTSHVTATSAGSPRMPGLLHGTCQVRAMAVPGRGTEHVTVSTPAGIRYIHAQADSFAPDNSAITLQTSQIPLWSFANTDVTTNGGVHGGLTGPWSTSELIDTIDGTSTGHVVMFPSSLTNNGHDFSTLLNTAS